MIDDAKNNLSGFTMVESSEAGMLTEAEKAIKNNEWIVFLAWTPHPIMGEMKIHYLDGMGDSGFGAATVLTNVRAGYTSDCPNAGKLLANLKFDLAMEGAMMAPGAEGRRGSEGNRQGLAQGQSGCREALARRRHHLRRRRCGGGGFRSARRLDTLLTSRAGRKPARDL